MSMHPNVAIPDDIVELILLRLDSVVCLTRAATTCKQWRRVIADAVFRRRYRSLHAPPAAAGAYHNSPRIPCPIFVPSPSATVDGRHFSLDFLPGIFASMWTVKDSRGSLLLLDRFHLEKGTGWLSDLVICEPLTRRYEMIPPLSTPTKHQYQLVQAFIVGDGDGAEEGCDGMNFRIVCVLEGYNWTHAGEFTSGSSSWRGSIFGGPWTATVGLTTRSIYFYNGEGRVTSMDLSTAELSSFVLPHNIEDWDGHMSCTSMTVTAGRDGETRVVVSELGCNVKVYSRQGSGGEWALEKTIELSETGDLGCWDGDLIQAASLSHYREGSVLIQQQSGSRVTCFRLDVETLEMQLLPDQNDVRMVFSIEAPLSPTLRACIE